MSEEQTTTLREVRRIIRVLERLGELARQATRHGDGALRDGQSYAIEQYNAIIAALQTRGIEMPGYFPPITAEASMGALGFASAQLAEYLSELVEAESSGSAEGGGTGGEGSFFNQFFGSGEFAHIGDAMRQAMPDWMREAHQGRADRDSRRERGRFRGAAEEARAAPSGPASPAGGGAAGEWEARLAEVSAGIAAIAAQMRRPEVSPEQLQSLAAELARLGEEQASLAREAGGRPTSDINVDVDV